MITNVSILGSTGSIGTQALEVISEHRQFFKVIALAAGTNIDLLQKQIIKFSPSTVSIQNREDILALKKLLPTKSTNIYWGKNGNSKIASLSQTDLVIIATLGLPGIKPTLAAIRNKKRVALATKEVLVSAGEIVMKKARSNNVNIIPIDSEHSAIFQCLEGKTIKEVNKIYLTCSGGPFRGMTTKQLKKVTCKQALSHPSWKMGKKITIDSATLMNKGFEAIEAYWLFGVPLNKICVIVHPQSVIHSAVEFIDGSIIAQLGPTDMRLPIQYALFYPKKRQANNFKRFSFSNYPHLSFEQPDIKTFRCLKLAYQAAQQGGTTPAVLMAANDIAVSSFLAEKLTFSQIPNVIEKTLEAHVSKKHPSLEEILQADQWTRRFAKKLTES